MVDSVVGQVEARRVYKEWLDTGKAIYAEEPASLEAVFPHWFTVQRTHSEELG